MERIRMAIAGIVLSCTLAATALAGADGAGVYLRCFACHQSTGRGVEGTFPPLAGHMPELVKADRNYPIMVVLYGLDGNIQVHGKAYDGDMPSFGGQLKDDEVSAVLNYILSSWGNDKMLPKGHKKYTPGEVKALRGKKLTDKQVHAVREKLPLK